MFRKGFPLIVLPALLCSLLFSDWLWNKIPYNYNSSTTIMLIPFLAYFAFFVVIYGSIYDIIHKEKVKYSKFMLGAGISACVVVTTFILNVLIYSNIYIAIFSFVAFICFGLCIGSAIRTEKEDST